MGFFPDIKLSYGKSHIQKYYGKLASSQEL